MRTMIRTAYMALALAAMNMSCFAQVAESDGDKKYGSPQRFEAHIEHYEAIDKSDPPPQGAIVCVGSSSMGGWHEMIGQDLAPLTVIPRGFGGSNMNDALYYADRIVLSYQPRAIVIYEGDNDIAQGIAPEVVAEMARSFVSKVHHRFPQCRIYFLSIKPSISRWHLWPKMKEANELIAAECAKDPRLTFVDIASGMLNDEGKPRKNIFKADDLHMTREGYVIWRDALRPILMKSELRYEEQQSIDSSEAKEKTPSQELKATDESAP